jgi:hypothetical protein
MRAVAKRLPHQRLERRLSAKVFEPGLGQLVELDCSEVERACEGHRSQRKQL